MNHQNNALGKALIMGFSQVAKSEEIREYIIRGNELTRTIYDDLRMILEENKLPTPMTWDTDVKDTTNAQFSDSLMMFLITALTVISIGNMGGSLALCLRREIAANYAILIKDIGIFAENGANIMIKNGWLERAPHATDREHLGKGKNKLKQTKP